MFHGYRGYGGKKHIENCLEVCKFQYKMLFVRPIFVRIKAINWMPEVDTF